MNFGQDLAHDYNGILLLFLHPLSQFGNSWAHCDDPHARGFRMADTRCAINRLDTARSLFCSRLLAGSAYKRPYGFLQMAKGATNLPRMPVTAEPLWGPAGHCRPSNVGALQVPYGNLWEYFGNGPSAPRRGRMNPGQRIPGSLLGYFPVHVTAGETGYLNICLFKGIWKMLVLQLPPLGNPFHDCCLAEAGVADKKGAKVPTLGQPELK